MLRSVYCFILIVLTAFSALSCKKAEKETSINGTIIFVSGDVKLNGKSAKTGDKITYGNIIETGDNKSICEFLVGDKNIFRLKEKGKLVFKFNAEESSVILEGGWFAGLVKFKKLLKHFKVNTPTMTASIRGTAFALKVEEPEKVYFCTCNGTITLMDSKGGQVHQVTKIHHGAERYALVKDGKISIEQAGMLYHDDSSINMMAEKIGEKIDWTRASQ